MEKLSDAKLEELKNAISFMGLANGLIIHESGELKITDLKSMASELLELREQVRWKPMDTAPKDGTCILLLEDGEVNKANWQQDFLVVCRRNDPWCWCIYGTYQDEQGGFSTVDNPEGWMPLPPAPERGE